MENLGRWARSIKRDVVAVTRKSEKAHQRMPPSTPPIRGATQKGKVDPAPTRPRTVPGLCCVPG